MNQTFKSVTAVTATALLLAACASTPKPPVEAPKAAAPTAAPAPMAHTAPIVKPTATMDPLDDPKSMLAKRRIYFDFDRYVVKPEFNALTVAHANYLETNKMRKIVIQGNADERGGSEYNLALGQKRAEAERKALAALGVAPAQMEAISFGKEKPKALGHDETSWAENRRDDIVYSPK